MIRDDIYDAYRQCTEKWFAGIENEVGFWDNFIGEKGGPWPRDYERRTQPVPPFVYGHMPELPSWPPTILDVGAGPISDVGISTPAGNVNLIACDALSPIYDAILLKHNLVPYVRSEFALVERLTERYGANRFDAVIMRNALDHAFYAVDGLLQLFNVAKIGGQVLLAHAENEAQCEFYNGFHQWNITIDGDKLVFWRDNSRIVVNDLFGDCATITNETRLLESSQKEWPGRRYIYTKIIKHKTIEVPPSKHLHIYDEMIATTAFKAISQSFRKMTEPKDDQAPGTAEGLAKFEKKTFSLNSFRRTFAKKVWRIVQKLCRR